MTRNLKIPGKFVPGPDGSYLVKTSAGDLLVDKNGVVRRAEGH